MSHSSRNRGKVARQTWLDASVELKRFFHSTSCPECDYNEAEGVLLFHCDKCCRKIVMKLPDLYISWLSRSRK